MATAGTRKPVWKRIVRFVLILVAIKVGVFAILWARWRWSSPRITYNPWSEYRAEYESHPPEQRAWDALREIAASKTITPAEGSALDAAYPPMREDAAFEEGREFLKQWSEELLVIREASERPVLGYDYEQYKETPYDVLLQPGGEHLGKLRSYARLLMLDTRVAVDEGDIDRAVSSVRAILGLSRQLRSAPSDMGKLVGTALTAVAVNELSSMDQQVWASMTDAHLTSLDTALAAIPGRDYSGVLASSERAFKDHIQRLYSDNGNGDGHVCALGVWYFADAGGLSESQRTSLVFNSIVLHPKMLQRREAREASRVAVEDLSRWLAQSPWERTAPTFAEIPKSVAGRSGAALALLPLTYMEVIPRIASSIESTVMGRDAARIAIAAERCRRQRGAWSGSLDDLFPSPSDVPLDMFSGQQLNFSIRDGRPFVYSVGNDRDDDGGRSMPMGERQKAVLWKPAGDPEVVDADFVLFPQFDE